MTDPTGTGGENPTIRDVSPPLRHCCSALVRSFWLSCWSGRIVGVVEVNGYECANS